MRSFHGRKHSHVTTLLKNLIMDLFFQSRSRTQSNAKYTVSKINFVDLAGSERLSKTKVSIFFVTEVMLGIIFSL